MNLLTRLTTPGPKRILALDGGGIKGAMTLGFLKRIEDILRVRHNNSKLLLSDYFDLIGGTSTGSIIAALLAVGKTVEEVQLMYQDMGGEIFDDRIKFNPLGLFAPKFKSKPLKERLELEFGDMRIDSEKIRTGLCIVTKRLDTGGTWPIINHPGAKYFKDNRDILLRDAVRASTAAPSYFEPEKLRVKIDQEGIFVDGGVSSANNPALYMFMMTQLTGFPFHWKSGKENILLVSCGTGASRPRYTADQIDSFLQAKLWAESSIAGMMSDAHTLNQIMLQSISYSPTKIKIDSEIGDMQQDLISKEPLLSYLRYDLKFEDKEIDLYPPIRKIMDDNNVSVTDIRQMDNAKNRMVLARIGVAAAAIKVDALHFDPLFDVNN
ncbi:MAG: patatin-like phospholipase family protein [Chitinophagales bacterium]|nr:patatin-like phospholipase family protein [Chitinophagaceae bacterium]MBP9883575.1 patatin-like phospholipase family protein [Chitinophagales bacterium]